MARVGIKVFEGNLSQSTTDQTVQNLHNPDLSGFPGVNAVLINRVEWSFTSTYTRAWAAANIDWRIIFGGADKLGTQTAAIYTATGAVNNTAGGVVLGSQTTGLWIAPNNLLISTDRILVEMDTNNTLQFNGMAYKIYYSRVKVSLSEEIIARL